MILKTFTVGPLREHPYLIVDESSREAVIIDPGGGSDEIMDEVAKEGAKVKYIINTHFHPDHIAENAIISDMTGAPIALHEKDAPYIGGRFENFASKYGMMILGGMAGKTFRGGEELHIGQTTFNIIHVPGHTPGSIAIYFSRESAIFTGDTLFKNAIGLIDLPESLPEVMVDSLLRLMELHDSVVVYPGHGKPTTIGEEREFIQRLINS